MKELSLDQIEIKLKWHLKWAFFSFLFLIGLSILNVYHWALWLAISPGAIGVMGSCAIQLNQIDDMRKEE